MYKYRDSVENRKENVRQIYSDLISGQTDSIREWGAEIAVDENGDFPEVVEEAKKLLARIEQARKRAGQRSYMSLKKWMQKSPSMWQSAWNFRCWVNTMII